MKLPNKEFWNLDWDKQDPIYVKDAIALWCNINPRDHEARKEAADKIAKVTDLFLEGKQKGYLKFPGPDDGQFYGDSDWYIPRKKLKSFAKKIDEKPLFLFTQKGKKKKYNIPPKPYEPKRAPADWEYIKRADVLLIHEVFEMYFGKTPPDYNQMQRFEIEAVWGGEDLEFQVYKLFRQAIHDQYFGNFRKGVDRIHKFPLPFRNVFFFLQEKNIAGLLEPYGYKIDTALNSLLEGNKKEGVQVTTAKKPQSKPKSKRHAKSNKHRQTVRKVAKNLWKEDRTLTIKDIIDHDDINAAAPNYSERTLRDWIKDLAPSNKPGRRPKKN